MGRSLPSDHEKTSRYGGRDTKLAQAEECLNPSHLFYYPKLHYKKWKPRWTDQPYRNSFVPYALTIMSHKGGATSTPIAQYTEKNRWNNSKCHYSDNVPSIRMWQYRNWRKIKAQWQDKAKTPIWKEHNHSTYSKTFFTPFLTAIIHVIEEIKTIFLRMQFLLLTFEVVKSFFLRWHNLSYSIY